MLAEEPQDCFLHHALGMEYLGEGQHEFALASFRTAMTLESGYAPSAYQAAYLLFQKNLIPEALHCIQLGKQHAMANGQIKMVKELDGLANQMEEET